MFKPTKLHPITYLSKIISAVRSNIVILAIAFFSLLSNGLSNFSLKEFGFPLIALGFTIITIIYQTISAVKTRYWIEDDKLILSSGVFTKNVKELYISRIQSIDSSKNIINQIFGGVILEIKTPGDGIKLDTISVKSADELTHYLEQRKYLLTQDEISSESIPKEESGSIIAASTSNEAFNEVFRLSTKDIILMSSTSGALLTVLAVINGLYAQFSEFIKLDRIIKPLEHVTSSQVMLYVAIGLVLLVISYIIGVLITALRYYQYQLMFDGERLKIRQGLFEIKEKVLIVDQIQAVTENQSFIRKLFGFTSFKAILQSDIEDAENILGDVEILPFIKRNEGIEVMRHLVPNYEYREVQNVIPKRSLRRFFQWYWLAIIILTGVVQYFWFDYAWIIGLVLLVVTFLSAYMRYKFSGYDLQQHQVTMRTVGLLSMETHMIREDKIIEIAYEDNYFLKRAHLASLSIKNSAGALFKSSRLPFIERNDALRIIDWFAKKESDQYETHR